MLQIHDLTFDSWGRRFFDHASVSLPVGAKVGLVGRNGVGKSTLFKLILGQLHAGDGEVGYPKTARVASVDQEHPATPVTLLDTVLEADLERHDLMGQLDTADPEHLGEIYARLAEIGADRAPSRAAEILSGLGFSHGDLARPMAEFSGGWRMRVALAAALFAEPDLLLLDEPTNYLDLEGALWLEARLKKYPNTAVIISHDREILNNSCDHILHLHDGKLDLYTGGYDSFENQRAERARLQEANRAKVDAQRAHLQAFVDRFRAKASKATQAQSRLKMLAKLPPVSAVAAEHVAPFTLPSPARPLAPPLIRLEGVATGYENAKPILRHMNLRLDLDDRIGLLGVNGAGKSTFAKLIAGALEAQAGELHRDRRMKVGWFHQHQIEALDPKDTPLEIIRRAMPESTEASRRSRLAQFGLGAHKVETTVANLSGGERARLLLNLVAMEAPHLLILDEPTNHLDIDSRRALLDALNEYEGAVILITHDRSLMELVADRLWLAADGGIAPFDGDMDDYSKFVIERARQAAKGPTQVREEAPPPAPKPMIQKTKVPTGTARRRAEQAEAALARATEAVSKLDEALTDPEVFAKNPGKAAYLGKQRTEAQAKLEAAEAEWLEAVEAYEAVKGEG
ncbi:ABC-F family ATP-binding cassette domain-containing protein [Phenylobacterium aquaticum]|uniref:ABC-F family ATP-binding cassette domain-containing protein n=1 Tax=Phenylobacterium aquaticum TaxID=1763816 RepID=UPI001F5D3BCB|nr:ABC-F family ATP-binding cassette domain-containing protein [Phenylobacterium aquaticum]MCI3133019.1 ATP-binding cassette domain-containing protein [Phenylobacterium aquaticum]